MDNIDLNDLTEHIKSLTSIDPKFLFSFAHKKDNVIAVWWYSLTSGEIKLSTDPASKHSDSQFQDVAYKLDWLRGRVFRYNNQNVLIVYFPKTMNLISTQLADLVDKLMHNLGIQLDYVIDDKGQDISNLLESMDKEIIERFNIKKLK